MKIDKNITTAANSRTMNAVEKEKLFAAAGEADPVIIISDVPNSFKQVEKNNHNAIRERKK